MVHLVWAPGLPIQRGTITARLGRGHGGLQGLWAEGSEQMGLRVSGFQPRVGSRIAGRQGEPSCSSQACGPSLPRLWSLSRWAILTAYHPLERSPGPGWDWAWLGGGACGESFTLSAPPAPHALLQQWAGRSRGAEGGVSLRKALSPGRDQACRAEGPTGGW